MLKDWTLALLDRSNSVVPNPPAEKLANLYVNWSTSPTDSFVLPSELRIQIYELVYQPCFQPWTQFNPFYVLRNSKHRLLPGKAARLHEVNKQLRQECHRLYLELTTFVFDLAVLDPETGQPTLVSRVKSQGPDLRFARSFIIHLRAAPKARPMLSAFVNGTVEGQHLYFEDSSFSDECGLSHRLVESVRNLPLRFERCSHEQCRQYAEVINSLNTTLRCLSLEVASQRPCLGLDELVRIAKAGQLLELLGIPARWPCSTQEQVDTSSQTLQSRTIVNLFLVI